MALERLQWGETYSTKADSPDNVVAKWGARAIWSNGRPDLVYDRQDNTGVAEDRSDLHDWLKPTLETLPRLLIAHGIRPDNEEILLIDEPPFHLRASANKSYGYLYIMAWLEGEAHDEIEAMNQERKQIWGGSNL